MTPGQDQIATARALLADQADSPTPPAATLGAAFLAATAAVLMAGAVVLGPGFTVDESVWTSPRQ